MPAWCRCRYRHTALHAHLFPDNAWGNVQRRPKVKGGAAKPSPAASTSSRRWHPLKPRNQGSLHAPQRRPRRPAPEPHSRHQREEPPAIVCICVAGGQWRRRRGLPTMRLPEGRREGGGDNARRQAHRVADDVLPVGRTGYAPTNDQGRGGATWVTPDTEGGERDRDTRRAGEEHGASAFAHQTERGGMHGVQVQYMVPGTMEGHPQTHLSDRKSVV